MIEMKRLKQLVDLMKNNDLSELDIRDGEETISLKRPIGSPAVATAAAVAAPVTSGAVEAPPESDASAGADDGLVAFSSPMVGTFYTAPDPDSPAFVKVGDAVGPESVICVIEAMKVFSEVKAETSGTVEKVLVKNAQAVEFGQALFMIRPS